MGSCPYDDTATFRSDKERRLANAWPLARFFVSNLIVSPRVKENLAFQSHINLIVVQNSRRTRIPLDLCAISIPSSTTAGILKPLVNWYPLDATVACRGSRAERNELPIDSIKEDSNIALKGNVLWFAPRVVTHITCRQYRFPRECKPHSRRNESACRDCECQQKEDCGKFSKVSDFGKSHSCCPRTIDLPNYYWVDTTSLILIGGTLPGLSVEPLT